MKRSTKGTGGCDRPWLVNWWLELEETGNQTDRVYPMLFEDKEDAIRFAVRTFRRYLRLFGRPRDVQEEVELSCYLNRAKGPSATGHISYLSEGDNIVFELSKPKIRRKK